jgi:hypothetical protein
MSKFTRHIKKYKNNITSKNKSFKTGGYNIEREGIIDMAENTASKVLNTIGDVSLRTLGLERINNNQHDNNNDNVNNVVYRDNLFDKGSKYILGNVNEVLDSEYVDNKVKDTAKDTVEIIGKLTSRFNDAMDDPMIKQKIETSMRYAGELADIAVDSFKEPFHKAVDDLAETANEAAPKFGRAAGKAVWDAATSIPPISVVGDVLDIVNDVSKSTAAAVDAGSEAVIAASDTFIETKDNINNLLKSLDVRKKMSEEISNRTTNAINEFENPIKQAYENKFKKPLENKFNEAYENQFKKPLENKLKKTYTGGNVKSKRRLFKRKSKTKRVKFAI